LCRTTNLKTKFTSLAEKPCENIRDPLFYGQSSENRAGNFPEAQRKDSKKNRKNPKAMKRKDGYSEIINRNSAQQSRGFWNSFTAM